MSKLKLAPSSVSSADELMSQKNTDERIALFLEEHDTYTRQRMINENVIVLDMEDVYFDDKTLGFQPRSEGTDEATVDDYANQAMRDTRGGIRKAISVEINSDINSNFSAITKGRKGHHRYKANVKAGKKTIPAIIETAVLSPSDTIDDLMADNAHEDNGLRSTPQSIKSSLAATMNEQDFMPQQKERLAVLNNSLNHKDLSLESKEIRRLKKEVKDLSSVIKKELTRRAKRWGTSSDGVAKKYAGEAFNNYRASEITKIRIPESAQREELFNQQIDEMAPSTIYQQFHYGSNASYTTKLVGELAKKIANKRGEGIIVKKIKVYTSVHNVGNLEGFYKSRLEVEKVLSKIVDNVFNVGNLPAIKVEYFYAGQVVMEPYTEDSGAYYDLASVKKQYKKLLGDKK